MKKAHPLRHAALTAYIGEKDRRIIRAVLEHTRIPMAQFLRAGLWLAMAFVMSGQTDTLWEQAEEAERRVKLAVHQGKIVLIAERPEVQP